MIYYTSAVEVFATLCYINIHLLTYLLTFQVLQMQTTNGRICICALRYIELCGKSLVICKTRNLSLSKMGWKQKMLHFTAQLQ